MEYITFKRVEPQLKQKSFFSNLFEIDWNDDILHGLLDSLPEIPFEVSLPQAQLYVKAPRRKNWFVPAIATKSKVNVPIIPEEEERPLEESALRRWRTGMPWYENRM